MSPDNPLIHWDFYGREAELRALADLLATGRFFFLQVSGRRRIGKTTLVMEALRRSGRSKVAYVHVADADPAGVVLGAREHLRRCGVTDLDFTDLFGLAAVVGRLLRTGWIVVLDEFQAFARRQLYAFNSALQFEVDRLRDPGQGAITGGLVVLGSMQTEMEALLEGRRAPLFGRTTASIHLGHLEPSVAATILRQHGRLDGPRLLFTWTLLHGIPKYWRDAHDVGALRVDRAEALNRLFFTSTAPLAADGSGWLLEELRGRYDTLLRYLAAHPDAPRADIAAHIGQTAGHTSTQVGAWLAALEDRFRLIQRVRPAFSSPKSRAGRYRIVDNFLVAWLGALAGPVAFVGVRPTPALVAEADARLCGLEGFALERLAAALYAERSRRGVGDFPLAAPVAGWWDRKGAEVDLVAERADGCGVLVGTCKRNPDKLVADLPRFDAHIERLLVRVPRLGSLDMQRVAIAPALEPAHRRACERAGYAPQDLADLTAGLLP
jgi:Predicted ATPase (AAA+ superfamily)